MCNILLSWMNNTPIGCIITPVYISQVYTLMIQIYSKCGFIMTHTKIEEKTPSLLIEESLQSIYQKNSLLPLNIDSSLSTKKVNY